MYKTGYVAVIGEPNVGKSTLINTMVGEKIAIVSPKRQTTRNNIMGILSKEDYQIVFIDTPGVHKTKNHLDKYMMKNVRSALDADIVLYLFDGTKSFKDEQIEYINSLLEKDKPLILVVTKIDLCSYEKLYPNLAKLNVLKAKDIVCISSKNLKNIDVLLDSILKVLPEYDEKCPIYDEDYYTDKSTKFLISEIVREKTLNLLDEEIPHGIAIEVKTFDEQKDKVFIELDIICERQSHKSIIIGKNGDLVKKIGTEARKDMEELLNKQVVLKIWVKTKKDWRNNTNFLGDLGYLND